MINPDYKWDVTDYSDMSNLPFICSKSQSPDYKWDLTNNCTMSTYPFICSKYQSPDNDPR